MAGFTALIQSGKNPIYKIRELITAQLHIYYINNAQNHYKNGILGILKLDINNILVGMDYY